MNYPAASYGVSKTARNEASFGEYYPQRFKPQFIIRNGGSDPHRDDSLTNLDLPISGFRMIGEKVRCLADEICQGRELDLIASGYNKHILPYCWLALISGLAGWNIDVEDIGSASQASGKDQAFDRIKLVEAQIKNILKPYWKCFQTVNL